MALRTQIPRSAAQITDTWPSHAPRRSNRLAEKTVIVMGGGGNQNDFSVGQATAIAYGLAGARVAVLDIDNCRINSTLQILNELDCLAISVAVDIEDSPELERAVAFVAEKFASLDIVHNNVGVPFAGAFTDFNQMNWQKAFAINCGGAASLIKEALPHFLKVKNGVIVNVSSIASIRHTGINYAMYNATKASLNQMTVALALEYADRGIRANAILPGLLHTKLGHSLDSEDGAKLKDVAAARAARSPTRFEGDVWDVANAAVFLASSDARYINGHLLVVDGGLSARC